MNIDELKVRIQNERHELTIEMAKEALLDELKNTITYFKKERECNYNSGWDNFSEAKGNYWWLQHFLEKVEPSDPHAFTDEIAYFKHLKGIADSLGWDRDYDEPVEARRRVHQELDRLVELYTK